MKCYNIYFIKHRGSPVISVYSFQPVDVLTRVKDSLTAEKIATVESAKAFLELLKSFRNAGKDTIAEVMTSPDSYYIV